MSGYVLGHDEAVIMQESNVSDNRIRVTLVLTNRNIIQVKSDSFDRNKDALNYPLLELKLLNGKPNIIIRKNSFGETQLDLFFRDYEKSYVFPKRSDTKKWASAIEKAYKAVDAEVRKEEKMRNGSIFFTPFKKSVTRRIMGQCSVKCPYCGADLSGAKGEQVKCSFCDSTVTIE